MRCERIFGATIVVIGATIVKMGEPIIILYNGRGDYTFTMGEGNNRR